MADTFTQPFTHHTGSEAPGIARLRHQRPCVEPTPHTHIRPLDNTTTGQMRPLTSTGYWHTSGGPHTSLSPTQ